jgi:hypothetical protein
VCKGLISTEKELAAIEKTKIRVSVGKQTQTLLFLVQSGAKGFFFGTKWSKGFFGTNSNNVPTLFTLL